MVSLSQHNAWLFIIMMILILPWKGYALWLAAHSRSKTWFIILLILNTFAILDIFYIFYVAKKTPKEVRALIKRVLKI